jgi:hypothetical protein
MYSKRFSTVIAMIALFCLFEAQSQQPEENPKPSSCDGVLTVQAEIPEILGVEFSCPFHYHFKFTQDCLLNLIAFYCGDSQWKAVQSIRWQLDLFSDYGRGLLTQ